MSEPQDPSTPGAVASIPSLPVRIVQVFTSPGTLFERLKERPVWLGVLLLLVAVGAVANLLLPDEALRTIVEQNMPPGSDPSQVDDMVGISRTWGMVFAVVGTPVSAALVAGLLILAYNVVLGGEASFRQLFSATVHSYVILTVGGLITLGLLIAGGTQIVMSPALLLPDLGDGYLARFIERINIFAIWTSVVLGIAISRIYPGRSAGGAIAYLLVLYMVLIALVSIPGGA